MPYYVITYDCANSRNNIYGVFADKKNALMEFKRIASNERTKCLLGGFKIHEYTDTHFISDHFSYRIITTTLMG